MRRKAMRRKAKQREAKREDSIDDQAGKKTREGEPTVGANKVWDQLASVSSLGASRCQARKTVGYKFKDNAFTQFAKEMNIDPKDVTLKMIQDAGGIEKWAFKGVELGS